MCNQINVVKKGGTRSTREKGDKYMVVAFFILGYKDGTDSVPKCRRIKFRRQGIAQRKNMTFRTQRKFGIRKILVPGSPWKGLKKKECLADKVQMEK
jgi:hypothetical protein